MADTRGVSAEFLERREVTLLVDPLESREGLGDVVFAPVLRTVEQHGGRERGQPLLTHGVEGGPGPSHELYLHVRVGVVGEQQDGEAIGQRYALSGRQGSQGRIV